MTQSSRRLGKLGGWLMAIALSLAALGMGDTAQARDNRFDHGPRHIHRPPPYRPPLRRYGPPPVVVAPPARGYYGAPPVVMSPPGLNIVIPIH